MNSPGIIFDGHDQVKFEAKASTCEPEWHMMSLIAIRTK